MRRLRTLPEALAQAARAGTGYCFVQDGVDVHRRYEDVLTASFQVARALREAGLRRGDLVAIILADAEQFLTTLFGASMALVIPASLYPPSPTSDLARYLDLTAATLRAAGARAVVTSTTLAPELEKLKPTCPDLSLVVTRESLDAPPIEPDTMPALGDIAFVQFTSGSTSVPKGVVLTHGNVCANVNAIRGASGLGVGQDDIAVSWLPLNHDMGFVGMALCPMYAGRPAVLLPPQVFVRRPAEWLRTLTRHRGTISFAPNFAYDLCVRRVKERDLDGLDLAPWRVAGCGSEPIHAPTLAAFAEKFAAVGFRETSYFPCYGLAEHVLAATFPRRGRKLRTETLAGDDLTERRLARLALDDDNAVTLVSCGGPFPGHKIQITGEDGRPLPERHVGEIVLAGPSVMMGYYRQDELTAQAVREGWLHTGDLGYLSDGELFVCGRAKDIIIVNGRKYHPQDLEWAVDDLAGVRRGRVVAFGASEPGRADRVVVIVEPSGTVPGEELTESIRRQVSGLFGLYVDEVALVPSGTVGRTTSGKVQRAATRARYEQLARGAALSGLPGSPGAAFGSPGGSPGGSVGGSARGRHRTTNEG
ncbi:MAG TPA: fatty acyl-AMP ligase [Vicinamibacterales bacterium]|jgi:acyl-CoA synthetase (AMP-forming)/AMP-acid ligase II|nr:fatty acyl-AMP ligase [Vicinamibacterales bacterium]